MERKITFDQYIANPLGGRVLGNTTSIQAEYRSRLDKILLRENGKVDYFLFKDSDKRFLALIKVPSEKVKGFTYDVVIEFTTDDKKIESSSDLSRYLVRFYSNDPAFVYTYAYSFIQNDLFIKDLESKMNKTARTAAAVKTNVGNNVGYVKSVVFAYYIMKNRGLFTKQVYETYGKKYSKSALLSMVSSSNESFKNRKQAEQDQKNDEQEFKKLKSADKSKVSMNTAKQGKISKIISKITGSKTAKIAKTSKKAKRI